MEGSVEQVAYDEEVRDLLTSCHLPVSDLQPDTNVEFFGIRYDGVLLGAVGLETCGDVGMLRSLAIVVAHREAGLAGNLVAGVEAWAASRGLKTLYLLTMTATEFFERLGYVKVSRSEAPPAIAETPQFKGLCPASSAFMGKALSTQDSWNPICFTAGGPKPTG